MRIINQRFIDDLLTGELSFFLSEVKRPELELCIEIRGGYINIYHRGGSLLKITQKRTGYQFHFDARYCLNKGDDSNFNLLNGLSPKDRSAYIQYFHLMMEEMDSWLDKHIKPEREYQHQLIRSNPSVVDIEYALSLTKDGQRSSMRLDMLAVDNGQLVIIENKYGEKAMTGSSGFSDHYEDICAIIKEPTIYQEMVASVKAILSCKRALGLPITKCDLDETLPPRILFFLANYNDRSQTLNNEVRQLTREYPAEVLFLKDSYIIDFGNAKSLFDL